VDSELLVFQVCSGDVAVMMSRVHVCGCGGWLWVTWHYVSIVLLLQTASPWHHCTIPCLKKRPTFCQLSVWLYFACSNTGKMLHVVAVMNGW